MTRAIMAFDAMVAAYAFVFAYTFRNALPIGAGPMLPFRDYLLLLAAVLPLWVFSSYLVGMYTSQRMKSPITELFQIAKAGALFFAMVSVLAFLLKLTFVSRFFIVFFVIWAMVYVAIAHLILRFVLRYYRRRGRNSRTIAVVGGEEAAWKMAQIIRDHAEWGHRFAGFVLAENEVQTPEVTPCLGRISELEQILRTNVVDEVIFATSREKLDQMEDALLHCEDLGVSTKVMLNIFPHRISRADVEEIGGVSMLSFYNTPANLAALAVKRAFDFTASLCALVVLAPLMIAAGVLIKITSAGPVFFRQLRCGKNGRTFHLLKFRSMVADAESLRPQLDTLNEMDGPVFKIKNDPRVTPVGRLIRRASIDELPQFINVLVGDMSVVGPRPPLPSEVEKYEHWQRRRLSVKPGITCYWQISGRNRIDFESWMRLDLMYIDNWSLAEDFKIILKTIPVVLMGRGAS